MRILIVDDEQLARDRLARMIDGFAQHEVVGEAGNGVEAVQVASSMQPEVVLMDIRMPGMDGLEAARHIVEIEEPPAVIFCTAYEEHAVEAFDLQAVGYLLKPVRKENLETALGKAQRVNKAQLAALAEEQPPRRTHISARTRNGIELIPVDDVRYFQADQKYVTVRHGDVIHADRHGAVVVPAAAVQALPAAVELVQRREKVILDACKEPGFDIARLKEAMARSTEIH